MRCFSTSCRPFKRRMAQLSSKIRLWSWESACERAAVGETKACAGFLREGMHTPAFFAVAEDANADSRLQLSFSGVWSENLRRLRRSDFATSRWPMHPPRVGEPNAKKAKGQLNAFSRITDLAPRAPLGHRTSLISQNGDFHYVAACAELKSANPTHQLGCMDCCTSSRALDASITRFASDKGALSRDQRMSFSCH